MIGSIRQKEIQELISGPMEKLLQRFDRAWLEAKFGRIGIVVKQVAEREEQTGPCRDHRRSRTIREPEIRSGEEPDMARLARTDIHFAPRWPVV